MLRSLEVNQLGSRIEAIDSLILKLVAHRMSLAVSVGARKTADKQPIYRRSAEERRIDKSRIEGRRWGLNESFVEALIYLIIGESCKIQMIKLQEKYPELPDTKDEEQWYQICRENLLRLTEKVAATYDIDYDEGYTASSAYRAYERGTLDEQVAKLSRRKLAVDLGCATGSEVLRLAKNFDSVVGFDLSPHMIEQARKRMSTDDVRNAKFEVADLENGIPLPDSSASFVFANFGAASDLRNIQSVIVEIERVLEPRGRYMLSFYNKDALVYCWDSLPWPIGLAAEINEEVGCLDVHVKDETFLVYGKTFTPSEVRQMFSATALRGPSITTFPTISPVLPSQLLLEGSDEARKKVSDAITALDRALEDDGRGAYIVVTGEKVA